ncbi:MAG: hypothetical protein RJA25_1659 [Bacteroidota bacterium]|jgi:hypothetical protein
MALQKELICFDIFLQKIKIYSKLLKNSTYKIVVMKLKLILGIMLLMLSYSMQAQAMLEPTQDEKLTEARFEYIRLVKKYIGELYWKKFTDKDFPGTIVYFTADASYFINPKADMKDKVSKYAILENEYEWNIWKLKMPLDSVQYVMETQFQFNPKAKSFINYRTPVLFCTTPEFAQKEKENINNLQEWVIALMHELYHQYQYSNEAILTYVLRLNDEKNWMDMDSLQTFYVSNQPFRDTLKAENELLKQAVAATSMEEEAKLFTKFLKLRENRIKDFLKKKKINISIAENLWEKLEGTSLMMEELLKENFNQIQPPPYITENDAMYNKGFAFNEKEQSEIQFYSELDDKRFYVGSTGYNMVRLLEKNKVDYKDNFFSYASLPLQLQLKYFYKIK